MGSLYKPTRIDKTTGKPVKYRHWYIVWIDEHGRRRKKKAFTDKLASAALLKKKELEVERRKAGLIVASDEKRRAPLADVIDDYLADLALQARSESHLSEQRRILTTLRIRCKWDTLAHVRADGLEEFMRSLSGRAPRTLNSYRDAMVSLMNWCMARPRCWLLESPLAGVTKAKSVAGKKHKPRRAYDLAEWKALCAVALCWSEQRGLIYLTAGLSGLRAKELRSLEKRDLTPTGNRPIWHPRAEIQKGRRPDRAPMLPECAALIAPSGRP